MRLLAFYPSLLSNRGAFSRMCCWFYWGKGNNKITIVIYNSDAYIRLSGSHVFDIIIAPSLYIQQANSTDLAGRINKNNVDIMMLLAFIKLPCQSYWLLNLECNQVTLKSFSHSWAQVSIQVKVRLSPPGPYCGDNCGDKRLFLQWQSNNAKQAILRFSTCSLYRFLHSPSRVCSLTLFNTFFSPVLSEH